MAHKLHVPLDVDFAYDDKILAAGPSAAYLYIASLAFCKRTLNDGKIASAQLAALAPGLDGLKEHAATLVKVGLWRATKTGWALPSWLKHNDSRAVVEARSEIAATSGAQGNHIRHHVNEGKPSAKCRFCIDEHLVAKASGTRSGRRSGSARIDDSGAIANPEGIQARGNPDGSQRESNESSSSTNSHPADPADEDEDDKAILERVAEAIAVARSTEPGGQARYRDAVISNAGDHLPGIRAFRAERPEASADEVAAAYLAGHWPAEPRHPATCQCGGSMSIYPHDDAKAVIPCPGPIEATVLELRRAQ